MSNPSARSRLFTSRDSAPPSRSTPPTVPDSADNTHVPLTAPGCSDSFNGVTNDNFMRPSSTWLARLVASFTLPESSTENGAPFRKAGERPESSESSNAPPAPPLP